MTGAPPPAGERSQERPPSSKTTKLESVAIKRRHDRRLVEYFVVVSSVPHDGVTIRNSENGKLSPPLSPVRNVRKDFDGDLDFEPLLTSRYPMGDHEGNPLHENVVCFCLPWGIQLRKDPCMPKVHYFVTTGGTGNQMYGVCLTTYEPFKVASKSAEEFTIYVPKCLCILSIYPYLVAFREYLTQLERLSRSGEMQLPVERYITNFCAEVPAPPPGSFEVQTTILDSVIKIWSPPHNLPIAWVSLPFQHLFECLDIENIITTWHILALERQVLFTSTQLTLLTTCCEIMVSLLFPMRWSHAYIPLVPKVLMPILSAPMPFLCGVHKGDLGEALHHLSAECIVVDLDTNQVSLGPGTPHLPALPFVLEKDLLLRLKANAGMVYREARSLRKVDDFSERGQHLHSHIKVMADAMWESKLCLFDEAFHLAFTPEMSRTDYLNGNDNSGLDVTDDRFNSNVPYRVMTSKEKQNLRKQSRWDAVQESFMGVYVCLLSSYRQCLVFPSKEGDSSSSGISTGSYGGAGFRSSDFIRRQRRDRHDFLNELLSTQMFDDFITKRLYGSGAADVVFFDGAIDKYLKGGSRGASLDSGLGDEERPHSAPSISKVRLLLSRSTHGAYNVASPLLQSSKVRRKLKTIVPPEPYASDLPNRVLRQRGKIIGNHNLEAPVGEDESVASNISFVSKGSILLQDEKKNKASNCFLYANFPSRFDKSLFGEPRPLPPAVLAEFDRQRENAAKFRRSREMTKMSRELSNSPEVTTFTVFFMAFASLVGKDLVDLSNQDESDVDIVNPIFSTYNQRQNSIRNISLQATNLSSTFDQVADDVDNTEVKETEPRDRFLDSLTILKVEEAKATSKAQLGLAFEMLDVMRDRELKADPVTYRCLIDACGRCGDTDRATELLARMHDDGIVADGIVYSCLVSAFSAENAWRKVSGTSNDHLPEWANGATVEVDWNKLEKPSWRGIRNKTSFSINDGSRASEEFASTDSGRFRNAMMRLISRRQETLDEEEKKYTLEAPTWESNSPTKDGFVTESIAMHIGFGENLLEVVYPDISIDTDDELCPRCNAELFDDDVVMGWTSDPQDYTTKCPTCGQKFVPKFRVQSTSQLNGSRGPGTPLICERLSPWVLEKELRTKMSDKNGIEDILDPIWREKETKNQVLWWNLVLSFMRYRLPFTFLLQGNFPQNLIAPTPETSR